MALNGACGERSSNSSPITVAVATVVCGGGSARVMEIRCCICLPAMKPRRSMDDDSRKGKIGLELSSWNILSARGSGVP